LILQGIETLSLRVERHCRNAEAIARYLEAHPAVSWVSYPLCRAAAIMKGPGVFPQRRGGILSFGVKGGREAASRMIDSLEIFRIWRTSPIQGRS
jgi:O-acetylhomoserine (thiol)-lyase